MRHKDFRLSSVRNAHGTNPWILKQGGLELRCSLPNQHIISVLMFVPNFGPTHCIRFRVTSPLGKPYTRSVFQNGASVFSNGASVTIKRSLSLAKKDLSLNQKEPLFLPNEAFVYV